MIWIMYICRLYWSIFDMDIDEDGDVHNRACGGDHEHAKFIA